MIHCAQKIKSISSLSTVRPYKSLSTVRPYKSLSTVRPYKSLSTVRPNKSLNADALRKICFQTLQYGNMIINDEL